MKKLFLICSFVLFIILPAAAYDAVPVAGDNYSYLFNIYHQGENSGIEDENGIMIGPFDILNDYRLPLFMAGKWWATVVNSMATDPVSYSVLGEKDYNASAYSPYIKVAESPYKVTRVNAAINGLTPSGGDDDDEDFPTHGLISLGWGIDPNYPGWAAFSGYHALNHSALSDLSSVMLHELMHSLGISSGVSKLHADEGDNTFYFSDAGQPLAIFDKDLRLYQGSPLIPFDPAYELVPQEGMSVGEDEDFDVSTYSPYFVGENTIKVLGGNDDYNTARQAIVDNDGFTNYSSYYNRNERPQVYGMPIHPADGDKDIDLSHLEVRNSFMSHQDYRNWLVPMEAELAVLKDIGYELDLRKSFGKSYYLNGVTDTFMGGYSYWDGTHYTGAPSDTAQGVGLHIYGNDNTIVQASDILTGGEGSFGVRIDGVNNNYTLKSGQQIASNGKENIGLGVTWGKNHQITVESGASIEASAADGIAASFDFGANLFGFYQTAKGSYIFYNSSQDDDVPPESEADEALVNSFDVAGTLTGGKAAIFIADTAHVKNINLLDGALINGNIISQWNSVSSAPQAKVQRKHGFYWLPVDPEDPSEIYFTQLQVAPGGNVTVHGTIDGGNEVYNTLQLHNAGNLEVRGDVINVNLLENTGTLTLTQATLNTQTGEINGDGTIVVNQQLNLSEDVNTIENTLSLNAGALLSTLNDKAQGSISIDTLKSSGGKLSFDLGDRFDLQNDDPADTASIYQIKVGQEEVDLLDQAYYTLFDSEVLDLGTSGATVYYDGNRYTFTQDPADAQRLAIAVSAGGAELGDAAADSTAANYIVTEGTLTQNAGTVQGESFEISGSDIDVNGHSGLVIDGVSNPSGTTLLTGIYGAADSNLTVQNAGELEVLAQDKDITLGQGAETALALSTGEVKLDSADKSIVVAGAIQGANSATDIIHATGASVTFNKVQEATLRLNTQWASLNNRADSTSFELNGGVLEVKQDAYLAAAADNQVVVKGGMMYLKNGQASDITLGKMTLQADLITTLDVDLKTLSADRFVFQNSADLDTQSHLLHIVGLELLNPQVILEEDAYVIPVVSADYHNENFLGGVKTDMNPYTLQSPIFRYSVSFEQNSTYAGLMLAHGPSSDYKSYNPAVLTSPVAAQVGGYLGQLNTFEQSFARLDMYRPASAQSAKDSVSAGNRALPETEHARVWANPYAVFGKVPLKNGPEVTNTLYGTAAGIDSALYDMGRDWESVGGFYMAYNGSRQRFDGVSIEQNGAGMGISGLAYKGNFFAELLTGVSMSDVQAKAGYGRENSSVLTAGVATKTGYTWELGSRGQWLLEPELLAAYTWVYTPAHTQATGVRIQMDPLQAFTLQPQLRLAGRWQKWGQPYAEVAWVGSMLDKTKFKANNVSLPQFSVKPFMKYGLGIRQVWAERWGGYLQTYFTSGGVRDIGVQAGISYAL